MAKKNKNNLNKGRTISSTKQFLDIAEIKDDVIILKDGSMRAVLLVSSINFALKSEGEQNAIISAYVGFLNNLTFPVQILIQSRELNIDKYIKALKKKEREQTNELLKMQTSEYIQYINELVSMGRIMNKRFYVVVPFHPDSDKHKSFWKSLSDTLRPTSLIKMKEEQFRKYKVLLMNRVENISAGLSSMSLSAAMLDTQSLIELLYNTYNPDSSKNQKLVDIDSLRVSKE